MAKKLLYLSDFLVVDYLTDNQQGLGVFIPDPNHFYLIHMKGSEEDNGIVKIQWKPIHKNILQGDPENDHQAIDAYQRPRFTVVIEIADLSKFIKNPVLSLCDLIALAEPGGSESGFPTLAFKEPEPFRLMNLVLGKLYPGMPNIGDTNKQYTLEIKDHFPTLPEPIQRDIQKKLVNGVDWNPSGESLAQLRAEMSCECTPFSQGLQTRTATFDANLSKAIVPALKTLRNWINADIKIGSNFFTYPTNTIDKLKLNLQNVSFPESEVAKSKLGRKSQQTLF